MKLYINIGFLITIYVNGLIYRLEDINEESVKILIQYLLKNYPQPQYEYIIDGSNENRWYVFFMDKFKGYKYSQEPCRSLIVESMKVLL